MGNEIDTYMADLVGGMEQWHSSHCDPDEWVQSIMEYREFEFLERFMYRKEIENGIILSLIEYWNVDWYECPDCNMIQESSVCDDCNMECEEITDLDRIIEWVADIYTIQDILLSFPNAVEDFLYNVAYQKYQDHFDIPSVQVEIENAIDEYYTLLENDDREGLLTWLGWANHICHVSGSIAEDYSGISEIYDTIDSVSNGIIEFFGEETVKEFLEG